MAGAVVLLAAACFGTFGAWAASVTLCDPACQPPPRHLTAQLVIAVVGLITTVFMTVCVAQRRYWAAGVLLLVALGLYAAWGAVLDQATHGSYFWE
jgi:cell division protein FtsW (lipid II flippase)